MKPLNILLIVDSLGIGGTETHVLSIAKSLKSRGHHIVVGTSGGPLTPYFHQADIDIINMPFQNDNPLSSNYTKLLEQTRSIINEYEIDIIHTHLIAGLKIAIQVSQELLVPVVFTAHGMFYPWRQLQSLIDGCEHVIAVSPPVATYIKNRIGYPRNQISIIPNGIDIDYFAAIDGNPNQFRQELGISDQETLVSVVSRIAWGKTRIIEDTIYAVERLYEKHNLRLAVVGSGPDSPFIHAIAAMVNKRHQEDIIILTGALLDPKLAYQSSDLVIGTARVALESMSAGKPVIAAGNSGYVGPITPENLNHAWQLYFGDHDFLTNSSTGLLANDLENLINNKPSAKTTAKLRQLVKQYFAIDHVVENIEQIYHHVLGNTMQLELSQELVAQPAPIIRKSPTPAKVEQSAKTRVTSDSPLVSIVIPTYNRAQYLNACLESVWQQSYRPLEIIVIDDCSSDNTNEITNKWIKKAQKNNDLKIKYHRLPRNLGFAHAVSVGYFLAEGDFIANHDSDDLSHPQRIEQQVQFLQLNEDYSLVGTNYESFTHDLTETKKSYLIRYDNNITKCYRDGKHCVCFGSLLLRKEVIAKIGSLTTFMTGAEDYEYVARTIVQGFNVQNIRSVLYYYRVHDDQRSREFYSIRDALTTHVKDDVT